MRITLIHFCYLPVVGGVEVIVGEHARLFAEAGHEVTVICRTGRSEDARIGVEWLETEGAGVPGRLQSLLSKADLVFVHNVFSMPFAPVWTDTLWHLASALPAVRFISWIHDLAACNPDYEIPPESLLRKAHPGVLAVAISEHRRAQFEKLTGAPCRVVPNGIDPERLLGLSPALGGLARRYRLLEAGLVLLQPTRILRRKNIEFSLEVTAALLRAGQPCHLLITGPADAQNPSSALYLETLKALRDRLGLSEHALFVHDHFPVGEEDLRGLYLLADALLFPSHQEGFGLPLLEAAVYRLPIFCPDAAPMNTLAAAHRAHLFPPQASAQAVATLIVRKLENSAQIQARKAVCLEYAWPNIFQKFLAPFLLEADFIKV